MTRLILCMTLLCLVSSCGSSASEDWKLVFTDSGSGDWTEGWFLEGAKASVENGSDGMVFNSGPVPGEHASHAVGAGRKHPRLQVRSGSRCEFCVVGE